MVIRKTSHARYELWYHIAWSTKYRKKVFNKEEIRESVKRLLRKIAAEYDMEIAKIEVMSDHVHILLSAPPRIAPSRAVQIIKSISTKALFNHYNWLKRLYWGGEVWVAGYFVRSVGQGLTKKDIENYIVEQSEES
jgi:putative transposase